MGDRLTIEARIKVNIKEGETSQEAYERVFDAMYNALCKNNEDTEFEFLESYTDPTLYD